MKEVTSQNDVGRILCPMGELLRASRHIMQVEDPSAARGANYQSGSPRYALKRGFRSHDGGVFRPKGGWFTMGILTADMRRVVEEQQLGFVATVCPDGTPNLSPKATTAVWDEDHLIFADICSPTTIANLRRNPAIEMSR